LRIYQLEAERDAAAASCRLMQDRVERLVEANLELREALNGMMSAYSPAVHTFGTSAWDTAVAALGKVEDTP